MHAQYTGVLLAQVSSSQLTVMDARLVTVSCEMSKVY